MGEQTQQMCISCGTDSVRFGLEKIFKRYWSGPVFGCSVWSVNIKCFMLHEMSNNVVTNLQQQISQHCENTSMSSENFISNQQKLHYKYFIFYISSVDNWFHCNPRTFIISIISTVSIDILTVVWSFDISLPSCHSRHFFQASFQGLSSLPHSFQCHL